MNVRNMPAMGMQHTDCTVEKCHKTFPPLFAPREAGDNEKALFLQRMYTCAAGKGHIISRRLIRVSAFGYVMVNIQFDGPDKRELTVTVYLLFLSVIRKKQPYLREHRQTDNHRSRNQKPHASFPASEQPEPADFRAFWF